MSFYIKQISVDYESSNDVVEFKNGLNIIFGPSNTGKTMILECINFMFGAKNNPVDKAKKCKSISMIIVSNANNTIRLSRKPNRNEVIVDSQTSEIKSGTYYCGTSKKPRLSDLFLKLIDITGNPSIITNKNYKMNSLTWRSFTHMFYLSEERIISKTSPLLTGRMVDSTKSLSAIEFLLTGENKSREEHESKEIREAKKEAVRDFINSQILHPFSLRKDEIQNEINTLIHVDYLGELKKVSDTIESLEQSIIDGINENKRTTQKIQKLHETQAQNLCLLDNYEKLMTQYEADLKRLSFIIDGISNHNQAEQTECPFCNTRIELPRTENENYINAAIAESIKIRCQIEDLKAAQTSLSAEIDAINAEIQQFEAKNQEIIRINETEYRPAISKLKEKLEEYKIFWKKENELSFVTEIFQAQEKFLEDKLNSTGFLTEEYSPKPSLRNVFFPRFIEKIYHNLLNVGYANAKLSAVTIDENSIDIVINGKNKADNGKGFRAFFNSISALSFVEFLSSEAAYKLNFIILDSPILSLKEKEDDDVSDSLKSGLFNLFVKNPYNLQIIIVENELPPQVDYKNANIVEFTKDKHRGRYGFIRNLLE